MARERKYFFPQVILTCMDKVEQYMIEEEEARLGRPLDDFEKEKRLREIIDVKIEKVVLSLGINRASVHFVENYKSTFDASKMTPEQFERLDEEEKMLMADDLRNKLSIDYRALRLLHECV